MRDPTMPLLHDRLDLRGLACPNRIFMAPLTRQRASGTEGVVGQLQADHYAQRATFGLIISEATQISSEAKGYPNTPGLYSDAQIAGWKLVTDRVHAAGGRIFVHGILVNQIMRETKTMYNLLGVVNGMTYQMAFRYHMC